jgi:hypothetical protein
MGFDHGLHGIHGWRSPRILNNQETKKQRATYIYVIGRLDCIPALFFIAIQ